MESFKRLSKICNVICLKGNHDFSPAYPDAHALIPFMSLRNVDIVDAPSGIEGMLFMPYYGEARVKEFIEDCKKWSECTTLFAHETVDEAQYENGFYAKTELKQELIPQKKVIMGHIHRPAKLGKVTYIGSPRWLTVSDANTERHIWLYDIEDGEIVSEQGFRTDEVCKPIYSVLDSPEDPLNFVEEWRNAKVTVDIHGPVDWIKERKEHFEELGCRVRTFPDRNFKVGGVRESEGVKNALTRFALAFNAKNGTSAETLLKLTTERLPWMLQ